VACRKGSIIRNFLGKNDEHVEGVRGIVPVHLHVMDIEDVRRNVIFFPFNPLLAVVPRSILEGRALRFAAGRLDRKRNGVPEGVGNDIYRLVRLVPRKVRGILRPRFRVAVPVGFFDVGRHNLYHGLCAQRERVAKVADYGIFCRIEGGHHHECRKHRKQLFHNVQNYRYKSKEKKRIIHTFTSCFKCI
jgi:hypothetical protein